MARHGRLVTGPWQFPNIWTVLCSQDALRVWPSGLGTPEPWAAMKTWWLNPRGAAGEHTQTLTMNCSRDGIFLLGDSSPTELLFTANHPSQQVCWHIKFGLHLCVELPRRTLWEMTSFKIHEESWGTAGSRVRVIYLAEKIKYAPKHLCGSC